MIENWKKGRGRLGVFHPLLGSWRCQMESERGHLVCTRRFVPALGGKYVRLEVTWQFPDYEYKELALFGVDKEKVLRFWSFTSDGKQSSGTLTDAVDLHPAALAFVAEMDAGTARQVYWPHPEEGIIWVVETQTKKGWNRFVEHHYHRLEA